MKKEKKKDLIEREEKYHFFAISKNALEERKGFNLDKRARRTTA